MEAVNFFSVRLFQALETRQDKREKKNQFTARVEFYVTYVKYNTILKRFDAFIKYVIAYT